MFQPLQSRTKGYPAPEDPEENSYTCAPLKALELPLTKQCNILTAGWGCSETCPALALHVSLSWNQSPALKHGESCAHGRMEPFLLLKAKHHS